MIKLIIGQKRINNPYSRSSVAVLKEMTSAHRAALWVRLNVVLSHLGCLNTYLRHPNLSVA